MKHIYLFTILSVLATGFTSCDPKEEGCGDEQSAGLTIFTAADFEMYNIATHPNGVTAGNATYNTGYIGGGSRSYFYISLELTGVCRNDPPSVGANLDLVIPDASVTDTILTAYYGGPGVGYPLTVLTAGEYWSGNELMAINSGDGGVDLEIRTKVGFPAQGGWQADSTYFFGNLTKMGITIQCKKPA